MKKSTALILAFMMVLGTLFTSVTVATASEEAVGEYQIKNIIYMIPDGGGDTLMDLANLVKQAGGFDRTKFPNATLTDTSPLSLLTYLAGFETTKSANSAVTDSAAGGTALSSGYKTNNGYIGITPDSKPRANILEAAMYLGKATGMVTTAEWPHATPASFSAHATSRKDELNIYQQIESKGIQVVLGAGYGSVTDLEGATIQNAIDNGYKVIRTKEDAASVQPGDKLWGNVSSSSLPYDYQNAADKASLPELVEAAITALSADEDGFFLMVEGSWVDSGGHSNNAVVTTSEYLSFDAAWKIAVDFAKGRNDTIVIGAPDHDTGGLTFPETMTNEVELIRQGENPSTFTWEGSSNHTARNCPVWIYVPEGIDVLDGLNPVPGDSEQTRTDYLIDNTDIAPYLASLIGADLDKITEELFVEVTTIGNFMPTTKRFVFNNGDKYFYKNKAEYVKDGETIKTPGLVTFELDGRFYAPAVMIDEEDWDYVNTESTDKIEGAGTAESPYLIDSVSDFKDFVMGFASDNYSGKYFKQTEDIDLSEDADLVGLTKDYTFAGVYNGNGHTINVGYETSVASSLFPTVSGTVVNLGVTGNIESTATAALGGIAMAVSESGKILNCYCNANFEGTGFAGIAAENAGTINNVYYGGNASASATANAIANGGTLFNCYYVKGCGLKQTAAGVTAVTKAEAQSVLSAMLCGGTAKAQELTEAALLGWETVDGIAVHESTEPMATRVRLYPETQVIGKGEKFQFTANVDGKSDYSWAISWSMEPQSEFEGTYIDKNGLVSIDANETQSTFTVMAKSKANGAIADTSVITVGSKTLYDAVEDGTKENPYLIKNEEDFYNFTQNLLGNETYTDKYFKQTRDLDMAGYEGYSGMGSAGKFYGTYDGGGHIINVNISGTSDGCVFPYTFGTIMNLGTTGTVANKNIAAGIARSMRVGSYMVNCWTTVNSSATNASGIASTGNNIIANCYFGGTYTKADTGYGGIISNGGTSSNNYGLSDTTSIKTDLSKLTQADMQSVLYQYLNNGRSAAAELCGLDEDDLCYWVKNENAYPTLVELYPESSGELSSIAIFADSIEIAKGSGRQLALTDTGISNTDVSWSITTSGVNEGTTVDKYGYVTIASTETLEKLTVRAELKSDASVYDETEITVTKSNIPDGTKDNPFIIATEADFMQFTTNVLGGNTYAGKYILQTANLDMAGYAGYKGMGGGYYFDGTYNGGGHVINVALDTNDGCLFPYTRGTIMNLGSTGYITNDHSAGGIARSLRQADATLGVGPGLVINCWSSATVSGNYAGGIAPTGQTGSKVVNCFVFGEVTYGEGGGGILTSGSRQNCYFVSDDYDTTSSQTKVTAEQMKTELHTMLNGTLADSAEATGIDESDLLRWRKIENSAPVFAIAGDVDGSTTVEIDDLLLAIKLFAQQASELNALEDVLDIDANGKITLYDLSLTFKIIQSLYEE